MNIFILIHYQIFVPAIQCWFNRSLYNQRYSIIVSEEVEAVMNKVDRANYVSRRCDPYADTYRSIGFGAALSSPSLHAWILEFFKDRLVDSVKALDVGCGSGYLTAAMAVMMGPRGLVIGIDHIPQLVKKAGKNVWKDNPKLMISGRVKFVEGDARLGYACQAPYDVIYVGASCFPVPNELIRQLKLGGRLIVPVKLFEGGAGDEGGQYLIQIDKMKNGSITCRPLKHVVCVPLTDKSEQWPKR